MRLVPYNYLAYFGVRAFSELIAAFHAGYLFVYPSIQIIREGRSSSSGSHGVGEKKTSGNAFIFHL